MKHQDIVLPLCVILKPSQLLFNAWSIEYFQWFAKMLFGSVKSFYKSEKHHLSWNHVLIGLNLLFLLLCLQCWSKCTKVRFNKYETIVLSMTRPHFFSKFANQGQKESSGSEFTKNVLDWKLQLLHLDYSPCVILCQYMV